MAYRKKIFVCSERVPKTLSPFADWPQSSTKFPRADYYLALFESLGAVHMHIDKVALDWTAWRPVSGRRIDSSETVPLL